MAVNTQDLAWLEAYEILESVFFERKRETRRGHFFFLLSLVGLGAWLRLRLCVRAPFCTRPCHWIPAWMKKGSLVKGVLSPSFGFLGLQDTILIQKAWSIAKTAVHDASSGLAMGILGMQEAEDGIVRAPPATPP